MPLTPSQELRDYQATWARWAAFRRVDWVQIASDRDEACWFVCRHGRQSRPEVESWTFDRVQEACKHLSALIKMEAPAQGLTQ